MGNPGVPSTGITAGVAGFVVLFGLAIACWFLFRSMNGHLRKVRYEAERREAAERDGSGTTAPPSNDSDPTAPPVT